MRLRIAARPRCPVAVIRRITRAAAPRVVLVDEGALGRGDQGCTLGEREALLVGDVLDVPHAHLRQEADVKGGWRRARGPAPAPRRTGSARSRRRSGMRRRARRGPRRPPSPRPAPRRGTTQPGIRRARSPFGSTRCRPAATSAARSIGRVGAARVWSVPSGFSSRGPTRPTPGLASSCISRSKASGWSSSVSEFRKCRTSPPATAAPWLLPSENPWFSLFRITRMWSAWRSRTAAVAVGRGVVDDDRLDAARHLLCPDALEAAVEHLGRVPGHDDHRMLESHLSWRVCLQGVVISAEACTRSCRVPPASHDGPNGGRLPTRCAVGAIRSRRRGGC